MTIQQAIDRLEELKIDFGGHRPFEILKGAFIYEVSEIKGVYSKLEDREAIVAIGHH